MLERQLDGILREEEKQIPLRLPPCDKYRSVLSSQFLYNFNTCVQFSFMQLSYILSIVSFEQLKSALASFGVSLQL